MYSVNSHGWVAQPRHDEPPGGGCPMFRASETWELSAPIVTGG